MRIKQKRGRWREATVPTRKSHSCYASSTSHFYSTLFALSTLLYTSTPVTFHAIVSVLYNPDQIRKMEESIRIRKEFKPEELIKLVKDLEGEFSTETAAVELPPPLKQRIIDEILQRLTNLNSTRTDIAKERGFLLVTCASENLFFIKINRTLLCNLCIILFAFNY
ncbi:hypothetical protein Ahy_A07g034254 isoform D [Arachis hypogaea]|uniref:Uncharacterized protein n=1 Tax=Arachis hypogaea TaxID=3818 RepID=A0A445CBA1_ARAHY|nr:hypothetical protein Ahy_A07g034254 isoform D [Arachis hypogaea]